MSFYVRRSNIVKKIKKILIFSFLFFPFNLAYSGSEFEEGVKNAEEEIELTDNYILNLNKAFKIIEKNENNQEEIKNALIQILESDGNLEKAENAADVLELKKKVKLIQEGTSAIEQVIKSIKEMKIIKETIEQRKIIEEKRKKIKELQLYRQWRELRRQWM